MPSASRILIASILAYFFSIYPSTTSAASSEIEARKIKLEHWLEINEKLDEGQSNDLRAEIESMPYNPDGNRKLARKLNEQALPEIRIDNNQTAIDLLKKAVAINPTDQEIYNNLGYACMMAGNLAEAEEYLKISLSLAPGRSAAWGNLGELYAMTDRHQQAISAMRNSYWFSRNRDNTIKYFERMSTKKDSRIASAAKAFVDSLSGKQTAEPKAGVALGSQSNEGAAEQKTAPDADQTPNQNLHALFMRAAAGDIQATNLLTSHANAGNGFAQALLGTLYIDGKGVAADMQLGATWHRKSAAQGDILGQHLLGRDYYFGFGLDQSYKDAGSWFMKAAEQGFAPAQNALGVLYVRGDFGEPDEQMASAKHWFSLAAAQNHIQALYNLGEYYATNRQEDPDLSKANDSFLRAAKLGLARAQYRVAVAYEFGDGFKQSRDEAIYWYRKSAFQGLEPSIDALKKLGVDP